MVIGTGLQSAAHYIRRIRCRGEPARSRRGPQTVGLPRAVARMERSAIREERVAGPGFRFAPSELRIPCRLWNTGSPLSRVMTVVGMSANMPSRSRGWMHPSFARNFPYPPVRGRRESRVRAAPAVSCAKCTRTNAHEHTGPAEASDFPCAVVSTGLYVLSPVTGLSCHRRPLA